MDSQNDNEVKSKDPRHARKTLIKAVVTLLIMLLACVAYWSLYKSGLNHTALLFVGLPTVLALALALTPSAKTITGGVVKGITLAIIISIMFLGEGIICVLMSAPLFYFIGISIAAVIEKKKNNRDKNLPVIILPALLLVSSLEGVVPELSFSREDSVSVQRVVAASVQEIEQQLAAKPALTSELPLFFRLGFPVPTNAEGEGLAVGDQRRVAFKMKGRPEAAMVFQVESRTADSVRFSLVEDKTKISSWLLWRDSSVSWQAIDDSHTLVTWSLSYRRDLDPYWYFSPLMQYAVEQAADYLITDLATPHG